MARPLKDELPRDARVTIRLPSSYLQQLGACSARDSKKACRKVTVNDVLLQIVRQYLVQNGVQLEGRRRV